MGFARDVLLCYGLFYIVGMIIFFMWDYRKLVVWRRAVDLIKVVGDITGRFPDHERYELGSQMRRAVSSISSNIAEGSGKRTSKDYIGFLHIAMALLYSF